MCTNELKSTKAITLISLVVTIVVLLILTGVSIITLTGDNGLINQTISARDKTKYAELKELADLSYQSVMIKQKAGEVVNNVLGEIAREMNASNPGTAVEKSISGASYRITGIKVDGESFNAETETIKIATKGSKTITVITETTNEDAKYYAILDGKYYEMTIENNHVKFGEAKTEEEINTGVTSGVLGIDLKDGSTGEVTIGELSQETKTVEISGTSNTGLGTLTVTYGNATPVEINIKVTIEYTVKLYASKEKATQTTPEVFKTLTVEERS